jgi:hypothetical protein
MGDDAVLKADIAHLKKRAEEARELARKLQDEFERAESAQEEARREPLKCVAERAHSLLCPYNHTDGCGWGYEKGWLYGEHNRWLTHYSDLVNGSRYRVNEPKMTLDEIGKILDAFEALQKSIPKAAYLFRHSMNPGGLR